MTVADAVYEIAEHTDGWQVTDPDGRKRMHPTAAAAQEAVHTAERELVDAAGCARIAVVEWTTATAVGSAVVKAIT